MHDEALKKIIIFFFILTLRRFYKPKVCVLS